MWWMVGPHRARTCASQRGESTSHCVTGEGGQQKGDCVKRHNIRRSRSYFNCERDTDDFRTVLKAKFETLPLAWRLGLDPDEIGFVEFGRFVQAVHRVGYECNIRALWHNLGGDVLGVLSLHELDPSSATALDNFQCLCISRFGNMHTAWRQLLNRQRSNVITLQEFTKAVTELGYGLEEAEQLFEHLRARPASQTLAWRDVAFLQRWEERRQALRKRTRLSKRWLNRDPCLTLASLANSDVGSDGGGGGSLPSRSASAASLYPAAEREDEWDGFKASLTKQCGSLAEAWDAIDPTHTGVLTSHDFQTAIVRKLCICRAPEARRLASHACANGVKVTWRDIGISPEEWSAHLAKKRAQKSVGTATTAYGAGFAPNPRSSTPTTRSAPLHAKQQDDILGSASFSTGDVGSRPPALAMRPSSRGRSLSSTALRSCTPTTSTPRFSQKQGRPASACAPRGRIAVQVGTAENISGFTSDSSCPPAPELLAAWSSIRPQSVNLGAA